MLAAAAGWAGPGGAALPAAGDLGRRDAVPRRHRRPPRLPGRGRRPRHRPALRAGGGGGGLGNGSARQRLRRAPRGERCRGGRDPGRRRHRRRPAGPAAPPLQRTGSAPARPPRLPQPAALGWPGALLRLRGRALPRGPPRLRGRPPRPPRLRHRPAGHRCSPATTPSPPSSTPVVPPAMLEAVAQLCDSRSVPTELAMESPMACGYGACFGCAVPRPGRRLHAPLRRRAGDAFLSGWRGG